MHMLKIYTQFIIFLCICLNNFVKCSDLKNPHIQKKLQERLRKESNAGDKSFNQESCEIKEWDPKIKEERFLISNQNTLNPIHSISPHLDDCEKSEEMIKIEWRYLFFESMHCIRVEFDFGNTLENFTRLTDYQYYSFSYRELGKHNNYLSRQILNESTNSLTIKRANLRPYIICVSFYKNEQIYLPVIYNYSFLLNNETLNDTTPSVDPDCSDYSTLLRADDFTHNIDLCVDIDTQAHFLSDIAHGGTQYKSDLLMVGFITGLLILVLGLIVLANFIIQKPKKRLMIHNKFIKDQFQKRTHHHQHPEPMDDYTALTRSSSFGTKMSSSRPQIVVTDFSSNGSIDQQPHVHHHHHQRNGNDDAKEDDMLLMKATDKSLFSDKLSQVVSNEDHLLNHHLVTFDIGETIIEEEENMDHVKIESTLNEEEKPSVASMSHILDDKPWLSSGRSNSIIASTINNVIPNFDNEISQLSKRFNNNSRNDIDVSTVNETNKLK
jgi:hypothetical protein